jgi:hypothetical protein
MFLQPFFILFVYYLLINKQIFVACVEEENMQLIVQVKIKVISSSFREMK